MTFERPIISIVTGTYNRLSSLVRFVESIRAHMPLTYEIVLVDGGSTDGTPEWISTQPDCRLIQHGALLGAIKAFSDGAYAALGEYILLANDDIVFRPGSLLAALAWIESHPQCGGVAFMDNRPVAGRPPGAFRAQTMPAMLKGQPSSVVYAQVGLFRAELGDRADWWGPNDPIMSEARTYGGDNYLSAKIWEMGFTIDIARGVEVEDHVVADPLRQRNVENHDKAYVKRYPTGPEIGLHPYKAQTVKPERIRVVYMPIYEPYHPLQHRNRRGLHVALEKRGCLVWEWDYLDEHAGVHIEDLAGYDPHIFLTQFHDPRWSELIDKLRELCPNAIFINWNGDARGLIDEDYLAMLRKIDLQLVVNAAALSVYQKHSIKADYWQIGWEPRSEILPKVDAFDVLFQGNCYSTQRRDMEKMLESMKVNYGLFGFGWQRTNGDTLYNFDVGHALYANCKIAICDGFDDGKTEVYAFTSNRLIEALASGAFVLQQYIPGFDEWNPGLVAGQHFVTWRNLTELRDLITYFLPLDEERRRIAQAAQEIVVRDYSFDAQVEKLFNQLLPRMEMVG